MSAENMIRPHCIQHPRKELPTISREMLAIARFELWRRNERGAALLIRRDGHPCADDLRLDKLFPL